MNTHSTSAISRRHFLQLATLSPLAAAAAYSPIPRTGKARLTPGLNAYSFLEQLNANLADPTKGIDLFGVVDFCAKHDIEAVDLTGYFFPGYPQAPAADYIARIKRYTHDRGITISGTGVKNDFATADKAVRAEGVALTKVWIEVAARLGAPVVRVFAGPQSKGNDWQKAAPGASREDVEKWMAEALRECAEHGEKFGVIVAVQNHGDFLSTGPEHISLLKRVDHAWCGALVDTGKYFSDDPYADIAMMVPHAVNWQIKETLGSSLKSPPTDFKKAREDHPRRRLSRLRAHRDARHGPQGLRPRRRSREGARSDARGDCGVQVSGELTLPFDHEPLAHTHHRPAAHAAGCTPGC